MDIQCENHDCNWRGDQSLWRVRYFRNPNDPDDVVPDLACPECGGAWWDFVEKKEVKVA